jgi:hypothetical protein
MSIAVATVIASAETAVEILRLAIEAAGGLALLGFGTLAVVIVVVAVGNAILESWRSGRA